MDGKAFLDGFDVAAIASAVADDVARGRELARAGGNPDVWRQCFGCLDLTSLGALDTPEGVAGMVGRAVELHARFDGVPGVAAVCVYPAFVDTAGLVAGSSGLRIACVAGGFPAAQTYLEVKMLEVAMAVENGADEVDVVMNPGRFLAGDHGALRAEIEMLRDEAGRDVTVKVIIESGLLGSPANICEASLLAMAAGADFIKTSTGREAVGATPEAAAVICRAIEAFHGRTGRRVGFKAAGGVATADDAVLYYSIAEAVLGPQWLGPSLFRIGASGLADDLLSRIEGRKITYFDAK